MKYTPKLAVLFAACASVAAAVRQRLFNSAKGDPDHPARTPFGKNSGGSHALSTRGHPLFGRKRIKNRQPVNYYAQKIDKRHLHSYGDSVGMKQIASELKRPTFA